MKKNLYLLLALLVILPGMAWAETGVSNTTITVGSVLALQGKAKGLGQGMKDGLDAAFKGAKVKGRSIKLLTRNDSYEPKRTAEQTEAMVKDGIFAMVGNVGTPTASVSLPILKRENIPAVGFFTGAGVLRPGAGGPILNYRASYIQETGAVIDAALKAGLTTDQICAFVQNDGYGMAGLLGVKLALAKANAKPPVLESLDKIMAMKGANPKRDQVGPVGVYTRNTINVTQGYDSLKAWEKANGTKCKLVVTVGAYSTMAHFARNAKKNGEKWIISAVSFTGADDFAKDLSKYKADDRIIMTQVVPLLNSKLSIVKEAKAKLGKKFGFVSLEGYVVGKMFLQLVAQTEGELTRENLVKSAGKKPLEIGGLSLDFSKSNQGSDQVVVSYLTKKGYTETTPAVWQNITKN